MEVQEIKNNKALSQASPEIQQALSKTRSTYDKDIGKLICLLVGEGKMSLSAICHGFDISRMTFYRWMQENEELLQLYTHARQNQADSMDDNIALTVEEMKAKIIDPHTAKVAISAYQWRAERLKPKVYGAQSQITHLREESPSAISRMSIEELQVLRQRLIASPTTVIDTEAIEVKTDK